MPPLSILIKPASSACNLRCKYCFYADEASLRRQANLGFMSQEVSHTLIDKAARAAEGSISFLFQGGEPTLAGLPFFQDFVSYAERALPKELAVHYAIQTNGTLLDVQWCRFFREKRFLVGLSLDGSRECHDRYRRDPAGNGSFRRVLEAARLLAREQVEFNVLTVVTGYLARHIQSVFAALCREGFRYQQYIPCLDPMQSLRGSEGYSLTPKQYEVFLKTLFDLWYRELAQGRYWSIRYFDNLVRMLDGRPPEQCSMMGCCSMQYLVEGDGSVYPCDFYGLDEYRLGNVLTDAWQDLDRQREALSFIQNSKILPEDCRSCRWLPLCRNGCRRDRLEDGKNYYCQAYAGFFAYALPRFQQVRRLLHQVS